MDTWDFPIHVNSQRKGIAMTDINITITVAADGKPTVKVGDAPITVSRKQSRKRGPMMFDVVKRDVLATLKQRRHKRTTCKYLTRELGLTNSQVYNAVYQLRADGWDIASQMGSASTGYRLVG